MQDLDKLSNHEMGYVFEHLIRKFAEDSNETAGEHFTPREVIELMVNLLIAPDEDTITGDGQVINILDPACGTGGMLTAAEDHIKTINPDAEVYLFGQELNAESWAICESEMLLRDQRGEHRTSATRSATTATPARKFDYMLANPPFGVEWKKVKEEVEDEAELGYAGRFGAGLPRINDGSFLFLQHMISKMEPGRGQGLRGWRSSSTARRCSPARPSRASRRSAGGSWRTTGWRASSPCRTSSSTTPGISTYFWILSNRKAPALRGKVILLDARDQWEKMRKSLGDKRKQISDDADRAHHELYVDALAVAADPEHPDHGKVKIFGTADFGYHRITVERPLKLRFEITEDTLAALEASEAAGQVGRPRRAHRGAAQARSAPSGGRRRRRSAALHAAARSGGALWPSSAPMLKAIWAAVVGLRPRRRGPEGQGRHAAAGPGPARLRERAARRGHRRVLRPRGHSRTSPTPGSTTTRPRSATRSPSPATSTSTPRPGPSPKSTPNCATWKPRSRSCWAR